MALPLASRVHHLARWNRLSGSWSSTRPTCRSPGPLRSGRPASADDFDPVGFLLDNFDLCAASGVVTGCANITAKVLNANFSLTGGVDVGADIDVFHLTLDAHATINEQLSTALDFQLTGNGSVSVDVPIPGAGFERAFTVGAFSGKIELGFIISVEGGITGTTGQQHAHGSDPFHIRARFS